MIVACGFDHAGYPLRERVLAEVISSGHEVLDLGTDRPEPVDYPDKALEVGRAVVAGQAERGILICGSGAGVAVAACKITGIRAATLHDTYSGHQAVEHDGVNVLCLGARIVGSELGAEIVAAFLAAGVSEEERHVRRRGKIGEIERTGGAAAVPEGAGGAAAVPQGAGGAAAVPGGGGTGGAGAVREGGGTGGAGAVREGARSGGGL